jgi:hypothetical protein
VSKHSPGPWRLKQVGLEVWGADKRVVANPDIGASSEISDETKRANAQLIAAAPDLLEACKAALAYFHDAKAGPCEALRAAIAKAEGENPGGVA